MTERRRTEARVRAALHDLEAPDEDIAEERGRQVVEAAFSEREPSEPRSRIVLRAGVAILAGVAIAGLALTPAGADVREWIAETIEAGEDDAEPSLTSLPAPGEILVEAPSGTWIVRDDGSRRRLGDYDQATWSPNGQFVGVTDGAEVRAIDPLGEFRWSISAPARVDALDWSTDEGFRVAYLSDETVRVVAGDGTGDELVAAANAVPPAWRPEADDAQAIHELTYVDPQNRVVLRDTDDMRVVWRSARFTAPVSALEWSADGERLLVEAGDFKTLLGAQGEPLFKGPLIFNSSGQATISPRGDQIAFLRTDGPRSQLVLLSVASNRERTLYRTGSGAGGDFDAPVFSPDGKWILLPWRAADQWLFVPVNEGRVSAVADIARQFSSDTGRAAFPRIAGWCCTP